MPAPRRLVGWCLLMVVSSHPGGEVLISAGRASPNMIASISSTRARAFRRALTPFFVNWLLTMPGVSSRCARPVRLAPNWRRSLGEACIA
jgi:hypothetical protein